VSLSVCRLYCNEDVGTVWPKPTGEVQITNDVVKINPSEIIFKTKSFKKEPAYWTLVEERFQAMQQKKIPKNFSVKSGGKALVIEIIAANDEMGEEKLSRVRVSSFTINPNFHSFHTQHERRLQTGSVRETQRRHARSDCR
jgi:hypothetical protein